MALYDCETSASRLVCISVNFGRMISMPIYICDVIANIACSFNSKRSEDFTRKEPLERRVGLFAFISRGFFSFTEVWEVCIEK